MKKYIAYFRKSTDTEDKQVLSLRDQARTVNEYTLRNKLQIGLKLEESYSAKSPGRPVFNQAIKKLRNGKYQGIIAYKLDRLTRNYTDLGTLIQLMEDNDIEIWTTDFGKYDNSMNGKMMMGFGGIMSKAKIDGLSEDTKRGMSMKVSLGWWAGWAPFGYLNIDPQGRITGKQYQPEKQRLLEAFKRLLLPIEIDPTIAPFIQKAFELYAYQDFSLKTLCKKLHNEGFRARGNGKLSRASLEKILKNPFYYGVFMWKGELITNAKHKPLITKELFEQVQEKLSGKSPFKPQPQTLNFEYRGILNCGECGCSITAERHRKKQKNGNIHRYIYYRCTKSKNNCSQSYIEEKELEKELSKIFKKFFLSENQAKTIQNKLKELFKEDIEYQETQEKALKTRLTKLNGEKKRLYRQMATGMLDDKKVYLEVKNDISTDILEIEEKLKNISLHTENWMEQSSNLITIAQNADKLFLQGTKEEKHILINCVASNLFLKDKKVYYKLKKPFKIIAQGQKSNELLPGLDSNQ